MAELYCTCGRKMSRIAPGKYACQGCRQRWVDSGLARGFLTMADSNWLPVGQADSGRALDMLIAAGGGRHG